MKERTGIRGGGLLLGERQIGGGEGMESEETRKEEEEEGQRS